MRTPDSRVTSNLPEQESGEGSERLTRNRQTPSCSKSPKGLTRRHKGTKVRFRERATSESQSPISWYVNLDPWLCGFVPLCEPYAVPVHASQSTNEHLSASRISKIKAETWFASTLELLLLATEAPAQRSSAAQLENAHLLSAEGSRATLGADISPTQ